MTLTFATIQSLQPIITFRNGVVLEGDVTTKEQMLENVVQAADAAGIDPQDITDEMIEESFNQQMETFGNIANLASLTVMRNGNVVFVNPADVLFIEIVTT